MWETVKLPLVGAPDCEACSAFDEARHNARPAEGGAWETVRAPEIHGALERAQDADDEMRQRWRCTRCGAVWEVSLLASLEEESVALDELAGERRTAHREYGPFFAIAAWAELPVAWELSPQRFSLTCELAAERIAEPTRELLASREAWRRSAYEVRVRARVVALEGECPAEPRRGALRVSSLGTPRPERATASWCDQALQRFGLARAARALGAYRLEADARSVDVWLSDLRMEIGPLAFTAPHLLDECDLDEAHLTLAFDVIEAVASPNDLRARAGKLASAGCLSNEALPQIHLMKADRAAAASRYDALELEAWTTLARGLPGLLM